MAWTHALAAHRGQRIRYVALSPKTAAGQVPKPTSQSSEYIGPILVHATTIISAAVFAADERAMGPVTTVHFAKVDPGAATFSSQLPVVVVDHLGAGRLAKDGVDRPTWIYAFPGSASGAPSFRHARCCRPAQPARCAAPLRPIFRRRATT